METYGVADFKVLRSLAVFELAVDEEPGSIRVVEESMPKRFPERVGSSIEAPERHRESRSRTSYDASRVD
jgi:hypothetical protein